MNNKAYTPRKDEEWKIEAGRLLELFDHLQTEFAIELDYAPQGISPCHDEKLEAINDSMRFALKQLEALKPYPEASLDGCRVAYEKTLF